MMVGFWQKRTMLNKTDLYNRLLLKLLNKTELVLVLAMIQI